MYYGSALTNMIYFPENCNVFILKSASYMEESISLWSKLIKNYNLNIEEVYSENNIVNIDLLNSKIDSLPFK